MQQNAVSFIAHTEADIGSELPRFIKDESDAFLECGILAHGFLRLHCGECGHHMLLAFSCARPVCDMRRTWWTTSMSRLCLPAPNCLTRVARRDYSFTTWPTEPCAAPPPASES